MGEVMRQRFKVFCGASASDLERILNEWVRSLHPSAKIRRTQLAVFANENDGLNSIYALVNYEVAETAEAER